MPADIKEFYHEFFQDVMATAEADGSYAEDAFFEQFCAQLVDAGELDTADRAPFLSPRGMRIDGYGGDPLASEGVLSLIIVDFNQTNEVRTLTRTEMEAIFKRASNFLTKALDESFRGSLEETTPAFGLADLISARWPKLTKVRLILISNRVLSSKIDGMPAHEFEGVAVTHSVWDLGRLYRYVASGHGREDIFVDFEGDFGGAISVLPAHMDGAGYEAYLAVVPGSQLAAIYDRWGARLLEQNVRVFLQARGNVNKGIRVTLENDPSMFFAYNNGITATAEQVDVRHDGEGGLVVTGMRNLQIVNGGQTTASIHAASRRKDVDLSRIFIQMKLSVVAPEQVVDVVPKISQFANTQNRVNAADFFANHPFHIRMQDFSRRLYAPSPDGTFKESKWFYERARGQYQDARAYLTSSQKRKFDAEFPRRQVFSKTDLAKFLMVWHLQPHTVSLGAQKNFAAFAGIVGQEWDRQPDAFNEAYYRQAIARAIIFREVERLVTEQSWYEGGYRANVVAYAISKLALDVGEMKRAVDFEAVWRSQGVSEAFRQALVLSAGTVHGVIVNPPAGTRNVTEWAKQQACWKRASETSIDWPVAWTTELLTAVQQKENEKEAKKDQKMLNGIEAQMAVVNAGGEEWQRIRKWAMGRGLLSPTEEGILETCSAIPSRVPTEKQSMRALETLMRLRSEGCKYGKDVPLF